MSSKAELFVKNFEKAAKVVSENAPEDLLYCVIIYARDRNERTEDAPD